MLGDNIFIIVDAQNKIQNVWLNRTVELGSNKCRVLDKQLSFSSFR